MVLRGMEVCGACMGVMHPIRLGTEQAGGGGGGPIERTSPQGASEPAPQRALSLNVASRESDTTTAVWRAPRSCPACTHGAQWCPCLR
jgi:hypothetical protein